MLVRSGFLNELSFFVLSAFHLTLLLRSVLCKARAGQVNGVLGQKESANCQRGRTREGNNVINTFKPTRPEDPAREETCVRKGEKGKEQSGGWRGRAGATGGGGNSGLPPAGSLSSLIEITAAEVTIPPPLVSPPPRHLAAPLRLPRGPTGVIC